MCHLLNLSKERKNFLFIFQKTFFWFSFFQQIIKRSTNHWWLKYQAAYQLSYEMEIREGWTKCLVPFLIQWTAYLALDIFDWNSKIYFIYSFLLKYLYRMETSAGSCIEWLFKSFRFIIICFVLIKTYP